MPGLIIYHYQYTLVMLLQAPTGVCMPPTNIDYFHFHCTANMCPIFKITNSIFLLLTVFANLYFTG